MTDYQELYDYCLEPIPIHQPRLHIRLLKVVLFPFKLIAFLVFVLIFMLYATTIMLFIQITKLQNIGPNSQKKNT